MFLNKGLKALKIYKLVILLAKIKIGVKLTKKFIKFRLLYFINY